MIQGDEKVMKAAYLENGQLEIREVPKPTPGYEEALIKMTAAGVCHSDVHHVRGDWPSNVKSYAVPMGHEGIGVVEALGPGAEKQVKVGDRVILGLGGASGGYWCGACEYCLGGQPRFCRQVKGLHGTYGEYLSTWVKALVTLPPEVSDNEVPLACGGLTAYSAVKKLITYGVMPGKPVAIIGAAGGLGHYAVQIAKIWGYKVIGIDVGKAKADFIMSLGADYAVDANESAAFVKDKFGGVYASLVFAPRVDSYKLGLRLLTRRGLFIAVGIPPTSDGPFKINPLALMGMAPTIVTSNVGTVVEMEEVVQLVAEGRVKTHVSKTAKLSELNLVLDELAQGKYTGRAVITDLTD